ncbi:DUF982 domain-containing protein [Shinella sp. CPCC 101442]|nr:DUF982 domain-containing protein [Shinella sp. CPCC 101442]
MGPVDTGEALQRACETCLAVLEGKEDPAVAREAFIRAAEVLQRAQKQKARRDGGLCVNETKLA